MVLRTSDKRHDDGHFWGLFKQQIDAELLAGDGINPITAFELAVAPFKLPLYLGNHEVRGLC